MTEESKKEFVGYSYGQENTISGLLTRKYYDSTSKEVDDIRGSKEYKEALEKFKSEYEDDAVKHYNNRIEQTKKDKEFKEKVEAFIEDNLKGTSFEENKDVSLFVDMDNYYPQSEPIESLLESEESLAQMKDEYLRVKFESTNLPLQEALAKRELTYSAINSVIKTLPNDTPAKVAVEKAEELLKYLELI